MRLHGTCIFLSAEMNIKHAPIVLSTKISPTILQDTINGELAVGSASDKPLPAICVSCNNSSATSRYCASHEQASTSKYHIPHSIRLSPLNQDQQLDIARMTSFTDLVAEDKRHVRHLYDFSYNRLDTFPGNETC